MMNFTEFHSNYKYKIYKNKKSNNILSTTWTGITLLPGALGAQVLDLLGPWHNCTGLIKSILRCKLSADDFRRAGLRRVRLTLRRKRWHWAAGVGWSDFWEGTQWSGSSSCPPSGGSWILDLTSIIMGVLRILASARGENTLEAS